MDRSGRRPDIVARPRDGSGSAFARLWAEEIARAGHVPMSRDDLNELLAGLADRLHAALDRDRTDEAYRVGAALVEAHLVHSATLARTLAVVDALPRLVPDRLTELRGALAAGYADALRTRVLAEQEEIHQATITARRDAERALRAEEAKLRAVFTATNVGMAILDTAGAITECNQALGRVLGFRPATARGRHILDGAQNADAVRRAIADVCAGVADHVRTDVHYLRPATSPSAAGCR